MSLYRFRYYITDLIQGTILGTDYVEKAKNYALSEDYFVVDSENGTWIRSDGQAYPVQEAGV